MQHFCKEHFLEISGFLNVYFEKFVICWKGNVYVSPAHNYKQFNAQRNKNNRLLPVFEPDLDRLTQVGKIKK